MAICVLLGIACPVDAGAPDLDRLETDDLRLLYFDPVQTYLAPHAARSFHNSLEFQRRIFEWKPYDRQTTLLLKDFLDSGNASASVMPANMLTLDIAPPTHTFETLPGSERVYSAMNHELVHIAQNDAWNATDAWWRRLFHGKVSPTPDHPESVLYLYLTVPRVVVPRWMAEGVAVFLETWMSGGVGRAQGAYDEMVFRAMVRDDAHFYSNLGLVSEGTRVDFQAGANAYLYGARFISYLALTYSPGKLMEWMKRPDDSPRYYADAFQKVFGKPLEAAWDEWIVWERQFQRDNLQRVRQHPLTPARRLAPQALGSASKAYIDTKTNSLVGGFRYPGVAAHVGAVSLADGSHTSYAPIKGPTLYQVASTAYDDASRTFFYTTDNNALRDLMALDLASGTQRLLFKDARIGDLAFDRSDRSLWGLRHLNGYVTLVRIPFPYTQWNQVHTWPYGEVPFELDVSADGSMLSMSMETLDGGQHLQVFRTEDMLAERIDPIAGFDFGTAIPEGFVFSPDGRYLFGSSYYTGISNIFRYEIATKSLEAVSNAETGFFRPVPLADGSLIVYEYTGAGFAPAVMDPVPLQDVSAIKFLGAEVARLHPEVKQWAVGSPADIPLDSMITDKGKYEPLKEMDFRSYPILEGYQDGLAVGWNVVVQDPLRFNQLDANVSWSTDSSIETDERLHADLGYRYLDWRFRYWHNDADFYDLFGPTERSRKGDAFGISYEKGLIVDEPRRLDFKAGVTWYKGLDTLPSNQNVDSGFEDLVSGEAELVYTNTSKSQGAVDHEGGYRWNMGGFLDKAKGDTVPAFHAGIDFGAPLPLRNSSIWLYNAAGFAHGDRENPLANWYFGAYGNNYVDDGEIKRYREYNSFPGFEIDELAGQDYAKSVLEWNITPMYFEKVGSPGFYLSWMRPALFAGVLRTDIGKRRYQETWQTLGGQLDFEFTFVHRLPLTLSIGYAKGYVDGQELGDEWMLSLKVL